MPEKYGATAAGAEAERGFDETVKDIDGAIAARVAALSVDGLTMSSLVFCGASILWFVVSDNATRSALGVGSFRLYILTAYASGLVGTLWHLLTKNSANPSDARLFAAWSFRLRNGPRVAVDAAHGLTLCIASLFVLDLPVVLRVALAASFLSGFVQLAVTRFPILAGDWIPFSPRSIRLGRRGNLILGAAVVGLIAVSMCAIWAFALAASSSWRSFRLEELRVVLVALTVFAVARQTSHRYGEQLLVQRLATLRNDIVFGHMQLATARTEARHLIVGGNLNDLIGPEIDTISALCGRMRELFPVMRKFVDVLATAMRESSDGSIKRSALREGMGSDYHAMIELNGKLADDLKRLRRSMNSLNNKLYLAEAVFGDAAGFVRTINTEFQDQIAAIREEVAPFNAACDRLNEAQSDRQHGRV